jgi:hypothetical protein
MSNNIPTDKKLYARVKAEAKRKFDKWPSAYASAWLVREYKKRGGSYRKAEMGMEVENPYADMYSIGGGIMIDDYEMAYGGMPEYKSGGGIPQRYKNKGFTKVGVRRKSTRPGKKWMVLAKKGDQYKIVHGGDSNMKDFKQHGSAERKKRFWDRMGGRNSAKAKDPFSPLYWHKRFGTWAEGGEMEFEPHMMYDPETGKGYMAEKYEDHLKMNEMGFTHDAPEMGYGGDLYKAAAGAAIVPIIKAVAPAVMGAFNKNKQAPAPQPSINIYNTTPQQSMNTEPFVERPGSTEEMMYGNGGYKYAQGGTNNPGFKALPDEVQAKILANMMYGGDLYKMGGMPCYECGGMAKYGKEMPKYQFAGSTGMNPFTEEEEDYMQQTYGTPVDNGLPNLDSSPLENMTYEDVPEESQPFEFIPGKSDNMRTTKNWMMQTEDGKLPTFTHKSGSKFNLDKAFQIADAASGLAGMIGKNAKQNRQLQENKRRQFSDNLYDPISAGAMGSRGDYNLMGEFRPDRVGNWNPYMAESYNTGSFYQEGGETEMTDEEIARLRAMGADIEILD